MPSALSIRTTVEAALASRVPGAFTLATKIVQQGVNSGIRSVDEALLSGLRCGVITELVGAECSGRTSLALAYASTVIKSGSVCAWVDAGDALCPEIVSANGIDLERMLWVRCGSREKKPFHAVISSEESKIKSISAGSTHSRQAGGGGSPHPRSEGRDMPEGISALFKAHDGINDGQVRRQKKKIGTPGEPNRPLVTRPEHREEQVNSDRLPPRRGDNLTITPRCAEPHPRSIASSAKPPPMAIEQFKSRSTARGNPWQALDQAIRATDLLLQSGGFSIVVLDLGSIPPEVAWRIPIATWFRFRAACERTRTSLLLLTQHSCARSSAELVVSLQAGRIEAQGKVMTGIRYRVAIERSRTKEFESRIIPIRKQPQSERSVLKQAVPDRQVPLSPGQWTSEVAWG